VKTLQIFFFITNIFFIYITVRKFSWWKFAGKWASGHIICCLGESEGECHAARFHQWNMVFFFHCWLQWFWHDFGYLQSYVNVPNAVVVWMWKLHRGASALWWIVVVWLVGKLWHWSGSTQTSLRASVSVVSLVWSCRTPRTGTARCRDTCQDAQSRPALLRVDS